MLENSDEAFSWYPNLALDVFPRRKTSNLILPSQKSLLVGTARFLGPFKRLEYSKILVCSLGTKINESIPRCRQKSKSNRR